MRPAWWSSVTTVLRCISTARPAAATTWTTCNLVEVGPYLKIGQNLVAVHAINNLPDNSLPNVAKATTGTENPAGLFIYGRLRSHHGGKEQVMDFVTDRTWVRTYEMRANRETPEFNAHPQHGRG